VSFKLASCSCSSILIGNPNEVGRNKIQNILCEYNVNQIERKYKILIDACNRRIHIVSNNILKRKRVFKIHMSEGVKTNEVNHKYKGYLLKKWVVYL